MKYILIWNIDDYGEDGAGIGYRIFDTAEQLNHAIYRLQTENGYNRVDILVSGRIEESAVLDKFFENQNYD